MSKLQNSTNVSQLFSQRSANFSQVPNYSGNYSYSEGKDIIRRHEDGLILRICRSKRTGHYPYYVKDCTNNRFVSSLFTEHKNPQFEHNNVRYEISQTSSYAVTVNVVNSRGGK